jgi:YgiT-type zinc finger domain-containing protein
MKCLNCKSGKYVPKKIDDAVKIEGGPTVVVKGVRCQICSKCDDTLMDAATTTKRTQFVLAALVQMYSGDLQIPGKVAKWMRKSIDLSATEWAKTVGVDPSTFSQSAQRNTMVDRYSSFVLLCKAVSYISGSPHGEYLIRETHQIAKLIDERILKCVKIA